MKDAVHRICLINTSIDWGAAAQESQEKPFETVSFRSHSHTPMNGGVNKNTPFIGSDGAPLCGARRLLASSLKILKQALIVLWLSVAGIAGAAVLSDPAVDAYNVRAGTQTFNGLYQFTTNTLLVETAQAIQAMGSGVIKFYLGTDVPLQSHITLGSNITNLLTLARDEPSYHRVLDMPFQHFVMWAYPFGNSWPFDGYSATESADDYREMFDLTCYLLTNYNNSGKTFYLGHWEGDWYLLPNYNTSTNPSPLAIQGMIDWLNNRQKAVDDAKRAVPHTGVNVFNYAEVNRVLDATSGNTNINQRAINKVVPFVTNLDYVSYSSYDVMDASAATLSATLNYMQSMLPTNKASVIPGERLWIGEYGWGSVDGTTQEQNSRSYLQRLLNWNPGPRFILYWEIYDNETNRDFWLIDSNNVKVAAYNLHQRFLNNARLASARFKEENGRLPSEGEFGPLVISMLNQPLPPPVHLTVGNVAASITAPGSASVSGMLTQGVYGDDCAAVRVFYGRSDGGTNQPSWEQNQFIAVNTNFNPKTFTALLTNLVPSTNYYFRFYATNSSGESWAPSSTSFSTQALNPSDFGSRLKITFTGYNRGETLVDFPALVKLGTNLAGFSYAGFASRNGGDLRFVDAAGFTPIPFEIDEWNTNAISSAWVRVPQLAGTNDYIWAYWGNPLATNLPGSSTDGSVWSADHFLVYHLKETRFPYADSTLRYPSLSGTAPLSVLGQVGHGAQFDGLSQYLNAGTINLGDVFTLSIWVNLDPGAGDIRTIWANKAGGYNTPGFALYVDSYQTSDRKLLLETGDGTNGSYATTAAGAFGAGQWHQVCATVDRAAEAARLFIDGADLTAASDVNPGFANQSALNLGRFTNNAFYWMGKMDEVRIESVVRSTNWLWTDWMTVASNAVLSSYSSVISQPLALRLTADARGEHLSWPSYAVGANLVSTTDLTPPITWTAITNQLLLVSNTWQVTLSPDTNETRFFRLQMPL